MRHAALLFLAAFGVTLPALHAQSPAPAFEIASIKRNESGSFSSSTSGTPGGLTATNMTVRSLISFAYRLKDFQLNAPSWTESERYDVTARAPGGMRGDNRVMMQTLLAERFKLTAHRETREQPVYALVVAREDGRLAPQLKPSSVDCKAAPPAGGQSPCGMNTSTGGAAGKIVGVGQTMATLAEALGNFGLSRMVLDRTGLKDAFDFELVWRPDTARPTDGIADMPSLFTALQEQLGLKLDVQRGPVEFLVVDRIERPTPD